MRLPRSTIDTGRHHATTDRINQRALGVEEEIRLQLGTFQRLSVWKIQPVTWNNDVNILNVFDNSGEGIMESAVSGCRPGRSCLYYDIAVLN